MDYKAVEGSIYCRPALTPPIVNSELAWDIGIKAFSDIDLESGGNVPLKPGSNVKLRVLLDGGNRRMTCHAKISDFKQDPNTGRAHVYLDQLSLSDAEFRLLLNYLVDDSGEPLNIADKLRLKGDGASAMIPSATGEEQTRVKAITIPVSLIEMVDEKRGAMGFSQYVVEALKAYMNG